MEIRFLFLSFRTANTQPSRLPATQKQKSSSTRTTRWGISTKKLSLRKLTVLPQPYKRISRRRRHSTTPSPAAEQAPRIRAMTTRQEARLTSTRARRRLPPPRKQSISQRQVLTTSQSRRRTRTRTAHRCVNGREAHGKS